MLSGMEPPLSYPEKKARNNQVEKYQEMKREDINEAEDEKQKMNNQEIPIAQTPAVSSAKLLPAKEGDEDELVIKFRKPYVFEGETFTELDLHGLEDLRGRDLTAIEKAFNKSGVSSFVPESTTTYAKIVATKVTRLPAEYFEDLPVWEVEKIKSAVTGFFYKDE